MTSYGLEMMEVHQSALEELDISGCYKVTRISLSSFGRNKDRQLKDLRMGFSSPIKFR